jgi:hypothetical protein
VGVVLLYGLSFREGRWSVEWRVGGFLKRGKIQDGLMEIVIVEDAEEDGGCIENGGRLDEYDDGEEDEQATSPSGGRFEFFFLVMTFTVKRRSPLTNI